MNIHDFLGIYEVIKNQAWLGDPAIVQILVYCQGSMLTFSTNTI